MSVINENDESDGSTLHQQKEKAVLTKPATKLTLGSVAQQQLNELMTGTQSGQQT